MIIYFQLVTIIGVIKEESTITANEIKNNNNAKKYYEEANELRKFIQGSSTLANLKTSDIVDMDTGKTYLEEGKESPYYSIDGKIFDFGNIESKTSNFNTHRIDVIKNAIERNLSIAISNFNNYSGVNVDFQMPKLKDSEWDKIMDNISIISFFQGVNIGGKVYNGYSIVTNTKNEDVVMEDSIYIKTNNANDAVIRNITEEGLENIVTSNAVGIFNINTEVRTGADGQTYYLPVTGTLSYDSIVTKNNISGNYNGNIRDYINTKGEHLQTLYYTALARERYSLYRQKLEI